jgi:nitrogen fixation protein NifQ
MLANQAATDVLEQEYQRIMAFACVRPNDRTYACMLASWQHGEGVMPDDFGLGEARFMRLLDHHFPALQGTSLQRPGRASDTQRDDEREEVYKLLVSHRANHTESEIWMASIVATACQGMDHLWQDMGLWSRSQLSELLLHNFPSLAEKNINNMKWKKFLYKQLCITEGIYTCRAPSCEVCADYHNCFGSED